MLNNRLLIIIGLGLPLLLCLIFGIVYGVSLMNEEPDIPVTDSSDNNNGVTCDDNLDYSDIEFEEGAYKFFDESINGYISRIENGVPAVDENGNYYCDTDEKIVYDLSVARDMSSVKEMLTALINEFADKQYSVDASRQIQRFYVTYYDRLEKYSYKELVNKLSICFPCEGANAKTLGESVKNTFGIVSGDDCAFVFEPLKVADIKVEFYNVFTEKISLSEKTEALCLYNDIVIEEDKEGYQRNLEAWLHNVILVADEAGFDEEKITGAQILYIGSLANAEYLHNWKDALIKCLSIVQWDFDTLKLAAEKEFGVMLDYNVPMQEYFEAMKGEVTA